MGSKKLAVLLLIDAIIIVLSLSNLPIISEICWGVLAAEYIGSSFIAIDSYGYKYWHGKPTKPEGTTLRKYLLAGGISCIVVGLFMISIGIIVVALPYHLVWWTILVIGVLETCVSLIKYRGKSMQKDMVVGTKIGGGMKDGRCPTCGTPATPSNARYCTKCGETFEGTW